MQEIRDFLRETICRAGELALEYSGRMQEIRIEEKGARDLVTEADVAVEKFIVDRIGDHFPQHGIWGEESGRRRGDEHCWVIDPIDGTLSFVRHHPFYSVSIALQREGETILGAVYAPVLRELFEAQSGCGAFLNGRSIAVSNVDSLDNSVLATGFACLRRGKGGGNLPYFAELVPRIHGVRRTGSAAMDLCYVACGRLEGFWELNLHIYDVSAGFFIVREAGGVCSDFSGGVAGFYDEVAASNGRIHDELLGVLQGVRQKQGQGR